MARRYKENKKERRNETKKRAPAANKSGEFKKEEKGGE